MTPDKLSKAEAIEICQQCSNIWSKGCIFGDIEGSRELEIIPPECLSNQLHEMVAQLCKLREINQYAEPQIVRNVSGDGAPLSGDILSAQNSAFELPKLRETKPDAAAQMVRNQIKMVRKRTQKGAFSGIIHQGNLPKPTRSEEQILNLLSNGVTTPKRLAVLRNCKIRVIQKHLRSLRKKGYINSLNQLCKLRETNQYAEPQIVRNVSGDGAPLSGDILSAQNSAFELPKLRETKPDAAAQMVRNQIKMVRNTGCTYAPTGTPAESGAVRRNQIRLHGQEFNITVLYKDARYKQMIGKMIMDDGNTIKCHRETIEVYSGQSFFADDVQKATARSIEYWNRYFVRLENDLKLILIKPRAQNIKLVKQEYAEVGNELATNCEQRGDKIRIYAREDGKLWFVIDNSFNLREAETLHPQTAEEDMRDTVVPFFNDLRDKKPPLPSDVWALQAKTAEYVNEIGAGLNAALSLLNKQQPQKPGVQEQQEKQEPSKWDLSYG